MKLIALMFTVWLAAITQAVPPTLPLGFVVEFTEMDATTVRWINESQVLPVPYITFEHGKVEFRTGTREMVYLKPVQEPLNLSPIQILLRPLGENEFYGKWEHTVTWYDIDVSAIMTAKAYLKDGRGFGELSIWDSSGGTLPLGSSVFPIAVSGEKDALIRPPKISIRATVSTSPKVEVVWNSRSPY